MRRLTARGIGTTTTVSGRRRADIASARIIPDRSHRRYLRLRTRTLAAPPCTKFCRLGGTRWEQTTVGELAAALAVVDACLRLVAVCRPRWWALENPPGRLETYLGPPTLSFEPWHYGDPWTKLTFLWGRFELPERNDVDIEQRNRTCQLGSKVLRSQTPAGFAAAFMAANP